METIDIISENLLYLAEKRGISEYKIRKDLGIGNSLYNLRERKMTGLLTLEKLSYYFGYDLHMLFFEDFKDNFD